MFYAWDITISAGTAKTSPKTQTLTLSKGVITKLEIKFPAGCNGLVFVRILRSEFQLIPLSKDEWITGDDEAALTEGYYELETTPPELKFVGASPDCTYDHTITVRAQVLPRAVATFLPLVQVLTAFLQRIGVLS